jgi:hypothetical protein
MNMRNHAVAIVVLAVALLICSETCVVMQDAVAAGPEPNLFELRGGGIKVTYSTSSFGGKPQLTYEGQKISLTFQGEEIRSLDTEIGLQLTVTLEQVPDLQTVTLTLILPMINLQGNEGPFRTQAIITTHKTSIGGPDLVKGALQTYRVRPLRGIARVVVF